MLRLKLNHVSKRGHRYQREPWHQHERYSSSLCGMFSGIILCMRPANERRRYIVTSSPIGWAHTQNDPWFCMRHEEARISTGLMLWPNKLLPHVDGDMMQCCRGSHTGIHDVSINSSFPGQNGRHFADDIFKCILLNENLRILIWVSLKFVPNRLINNKSALVRAMAWRLTGDKPLPKLRIT